MRFQVVTIFPEFFRGPLGCGVLGRARAAGLVSVQVHDLRSWTSDRHRTVDSRPFGGGEGMVLRVEPFDRALADIRSPDEGRSVHTVLLSAQGRLFDQAYARRLAGMDEIVLLCGRYEGVDERVALHLADEEVSVGSFVLSGGEFAAGIIIDAVTRLLPGVLGNRESATHESFAAQPEGAVGVLDHPQYTRPASYRSPRSEGQSWDVPEVLRSGHHAEVARWRREAALAKTRENRPDLLEAERASAHSGPLGRQ